MLRLQLKTPRKRDLHRLLTRAARAKVINRRSDQYRDLVRQEAAIGGQLFGPVPNNVRREFVCLNKRTWVWHEEWFDGNGGHHRMTTRYDVYPYGVYKAQDGQPYQRLSTVEAQHLQKAVLLYNTQVKTELYAQQ